MSSLFGHREKWYDYSKFMITQPEKQGIKIHILPNISRSKGNQTMKFVELI